MEQRGAPGHIDLNEEPRLWKTADLELLNAFRTGQEASPGLPAQHARLLRLPVFTANRQTLAAAERCARAGRCPATSGRSLLEPSLPAVNICNGKARREGNLPSAGGSHPPPNASLYKCEGAKTARRWG